MTIIDKINKAINSKDSIKSVLSNNGVTTDNVFSKYDDYVEEAVVKNSLFMPVSATTVTTSSGTANYASSKYINIVDENKKIWSIADWNARWVANGKKTTGLSKPIGINFKSNKLDFNLYWNYVGTTYRVNGATLSNAMIHSPYAESPINNAQSGTDYVVTQGTIGTDAGNYTSGAWSVTSYDTNNWALYTANTKQTFLIPKNCGAANAMLVLNCQDRMTAIINQTEWCRHRMAINSGISTTSVDGTYTTVDILNANGNTAAVNEDMYFWIDGLNTGLLAKYNVTNHYGTNSYNGDNTVMTTIYNTLKAGGWNMNDTGINSANHKLLPPGAKGAEAIAVNGKWMITTPYLIFATANTINDNITMDCHAVSYCNYAKTLYGENTVMPTEQMLYPYWTNRNLVLGIVNYLRTVEGQTTQVPAVPSAYIWSIVRSSANSSWGVYSSNGYCSYVYTCNGSYVVPSALNN